MNKTDPPDQQILHMKNTTETFHVEAQSFTIYKIKKLSVVAKWYFC